MGDILVEQIKLLPMPQDLTSANRTWSLPFELRNDSVSFSTLTALMDQFKENTQGRRKVSIISKLLRHRALISLNTLFGLVEQQVASVQFADVETFL